MREKNFETGQIRLPLLRNLQFGHDGRQFTGATLTRAWKTCVLYFMMEEMGMRD